MSIKECDNFLEKSFGKFTGNLVQAVILSETFIAY